jgi:hypothetical protein
MRYHFRTNNGRTCCKADAVTALCSACQAQVRAQSPTTASSARRAGVSRDEEAVPPPPDLNAAIREAWVKRRAPQLPRATAPTPEMRAAAVRENMKPVAPPEEVSPAIRTVSRRAYALEHDVPPAISNVEQNARIRAAAGGGR